MRSVFVALCVVLCLSAVTVGWAVGAEPDGAAFARQREQTEAAVPNFWGPALGSTRREMYADAPDGQRTVQYFDKARMEQRAPDAAVTNGLLTVELITGKRQFGDTRFRPFPPATLPIVGDGDNAWPPYAALGAAVFPEKSAPTTDPIATVYKLDGTFGTNAGLAAQPEAAIGAFGRDPGGRYAHNIPVAFSRYLDALPVPWVGAMGYPLTEPFWVNVRVGGVATWVMVQPFERRVLSWTPTNPPAYRVEMGNIGQHYARWRYTVAPGEDATATGTPGTPGTMTVKPGTATTGTPAASGTPDSTAAATTLAVTNLRFGTVSDDGLTLTFQTSRAATTQVLYGTASHSYAVQMDISTDPVREHSVALSGLDPKTKYYFVVRATAGGDTADSKESFFTTTGTGAIAANTPTAASTFTTNAATAKPPTDTPTPKPPTETPTSKSPTETPTPRPPTETPTPKPPTATNTPVPKQVRVTVQRVEINVLNPIYLPAIDTEKTTITTVLTTTGTYAKESFVAHPAPWTESNGRTTISTTDTATNPLLVPDHQTSVNVTITAEIRTTAGETLTVTAEQIIGVGEYRSGKTFALLRNPGTGTANITLVIAAALV